MAELCSCDRDCRMHNTGKIYHLALYRSVPTLDGAKTQLPCSTQPGLLSKRRGECFQSSFRKALHTHNPQIYLMIIHIWTTVIHSNSNLRILYWLLLSDSCSSLSWKTTLLIFLLLHWPLLLHLLYQFPLSSQVLSVGASSVISPGPSYRLPSFTSQMILFDFLFFLIYKKLFISGSAGSSLLLGLFSTCSEWGYSLVEVHGLLIALTSFFWGAPSPEYRLDRCGGKA